MNLKFYLRGLGIGIIVTAIIMLVISYQNRTTLTDAQIKARAQELGMVDESTSLANMAQANLDEIKDNQDSESVSPSENTGDSLPPSDEISSSEEAGTAAIEENTDEAQLVTSPEDIPQVDSELDLNDVEDVLNQADAYLESKNDPNAKKNQASKAPAETKEPEASVAPAETKKPEASKEPEKTKEPESSKAPESASNSANEGDTKLVISKGESSYTVAKHLAELGLIDNANEFDTYLCSVGKDRYISTGTYNLSKGMSEEEIANRIAR